MCVQSDNSKIEVIKWLIYDKGQRSEAIHQGNALMRQFLGGYSPLLVTALPDTVFMCYYSNQKTVCS